MYAFEHTDGEYHLAIYYFKPRVPVDSKSCKCVN